MFSPKFHHTSAIRPRRKCELWACRMRENICFNFFNIFILIAACLIKLLSVGDKYCGRWWMFMLFFKFLYFSLINLIFSVPKFFGFFMNNFPAFSELPNEILNEILMKFRKCNKIFSIHIISEIHSIEKCVFYYVIIFCPNLRFKKKKMK